MRIIRKEDFDIEQVDGDGDWSNSRGASGAADRVHQ
jgi:hypothetical protein